MQINIVHVRVCVHVYIYIQGVPGGKDLTSGECSLGQTITILLCTTHYASDMLFFRL